MTDRETPKIETRSAKEIYDYLEKRLKQLELTADRGDALAEALLRVFARYCEIIIERLNQVPNKNYLAFLNLLGVSRIPPVPAQVPLTFYPVKQLPRAGASVPARTKVAAPPSSGESEPVVFETVRLIELTSAELKRVVALDPQEDLYADRSVLTTPEGSPGEIAFAGKLPVEHEFYTGHREIFGTQGISKLRLGFDIESRYSRRGNARLIEWRIPTAQGAIILTPSKDTTEQLTRSGEVVFTNLPKWPSHEIFGWENHWLNCRLLVRLKSLPKIKSHDESFFQIPRVRAIQLSAIWEVQGAPIEHAFFNNLPLDTGKDFFPFGERPRFGDVFYVSSEVFSKQDAKITLSIKLTNPVSAGEKSPIRPVNRQGKPGIQWESWDGSRWLRLDCKDETQALTENGAIYFIMPSSALRTLVNGVEGFWIRARLASGNYGEEERFEFVSQEQLGQGLRHLPSTLAPPAVQSITVSCSTSIGPELPEKVITQNNLMFEEVDLGKITSFLPFRPADSPRKSLYFGFDVPHVQALANRPIDLYFQIGEPAGRMFFRDERRQYLPSLEWQYWNGERWQQCSISDGTAYLTVSGIVSIRVGEDILPWQQSTISPELCWMRVLWEAGKDQYPPVLRRITLNTVPATHTVTLENELLGSSNGIPDQTFRSARVPILGGLQLEVREPSMPAEEELSRIYRDEGRDAITVKRLQGLTQEIWVRWHEVIDFSSSGGHDRHFVVDRLTGEIRFGNGLWGLIPPSGANNIRLRSYQTGGGSRGNVPAQSVMQLRTTVPFVGSVANLEAASGGQDIEEWNSVRERGSCRLRHRDRAVTAEDYEDLAKEASPVVARTKCYPLRDLLKDPLAKRLWPGVVSVVIVPRSTDVNPKPTVELLRSVWQFLDRHRALDVDMVVLAAEYVRITVEAEVVAAASLTSDLIIECEKRLHEYLHPLTGGPESQGWAFGQQPQQSDLYALLEAICGLEYVRSLKIRYEEEHPDLLMSGLFLICSGQHKVRLSW